MRKFVKRVKCSYLGRNVFGEVKFNIAFLGPINKSFDVVTEFDNEEMAIVKACRENGINPVIPLINWWRIIHDGWHCSKFTKHRIASLLKNRIDSTDYLKNLNLTKCLIRTYTRHYLTWIAK